MGDKVGGLASGAGWCLFRQPSTCAAARRATRLPQRSDGPSGRRGAGQGTPLVLRAGCAAARPAARLPAGPHPQGCQRRVARRCGGAHAG